MSFYVNPHSHQCPWYPYAELLGYPGAKSCEVVSCSMIANPASAWASLFFVLSAAVLFFFYYKNPKENLKSFPTLVLLCAFAHFIFHSSLNYIFELLSTMSIAYILVYALVLNLNLLEVLSKKSLVPIRIGLFSILVIVSNMLYRSFIGNEFIFLILAIALLSSEWLLKKRIKKYQFSHWTLLSLGSFSIASATKVFEMTNLYCSPKNHLFQLNTITYFFLSLAFIFLYKHFESESFMERANLDYDMDEVETQLEV